MHIYELSSHRLMVTMGTKKLENPQISTK